MIRNVTKQFFVGLGLSGALVLSSGAQPAPKLTSIFPEAVQRGTTVGLTFVGENLTGVTGVVLSDASGLITAELQPAPPPPKASVTLESNLGGIAPIAAPLRLVVRVTIAEDAPLTARQLRLISPRGLSNPATLTVGPRIDVPQIAEKEPNNSLEQAQVVALPALISGTISTSVQVDYYRFKASKGQELVFEVEAARRGSALDSSLAILDGSGRELARSEDAKGLDSLIHFTVPQDGEYLAQLRDFRYQGGGNYTYRLWAGALPYVDSIFPLGAQRGKPAQIALQGVNLAGTTQMTFEIAPGAPLGPQEFRARTPNGLSNPFMFDVANFPDFTETEPNNTLDKANVVPLPVVINGQIGEAKDLDRYKFKSSVDQKLICELLASRFGSRLDGLLILSDAAGVVLAQNDDSALSDSRLEFDAKKDVEYVLTVRDLTQRGGKNFAYRLSIGPPVVQGAAEPAFAVKFQPDTPRVHRGGRTKLRCDASAVAGFEGPVRISLLDPPAGIVDESLTAPSLPSSGWLIVNALRDAPLGTFPLKVVARGLFKGKIVTRLAEPSQAFLTVLEPLPFSVEAASLSVTVEQTQSASVGVVVHRNEGFTGDVKVVVEGFSGDAGEVVLKGSDAVGQINLTAKLDSEPGTRALVARGDLAMDGQTFSQSSRPFPVTVNPFPFVLSSTLAKLMITALPTNSSSAANETASAIKLERRAGFNGEVQLTLEGLPPGIQVTLDKIPANGGESTLKLVATEKAPVGTNSITILGTGVHNDRNYRQRTGAITLVVSAPDPMEKNPPPTAAFPAPVAPGTK